MKSRLKMLVCLVAAVFLTTAMMTCGGGGNGGGGSDSRVDSSKIVGTWRITWAVASCTSGNVTIGMGGGPVNYIITAVDQDTISLGASGSQHKYTLNLTFAQNGGLEALWETVDMSDLRCSADQKLGELRDKNLLHFNPDYSTGFVDEEFSFGKNTACGGCTDHAQSEMSRVASGTPGSSLPSAGGGARITDSGKAIWIDSRDGADYVAP